MISRTSFTSSQLMYTTFSHEIFNDIRTSRTEFCTGPDWEGPQLLSRDWNGVFQFHAVMKFFFWGNEHFVVVLSILARWEWTFSLKRLWLHSKLPLFSTLICLPAFSSYERFVRSACISINPVLGEFVAFSSGNLVNSLHILKRFCHIPAIQLNLIEKSVTYL